MKSEGRSIRSILVRGYLIAMSIAIVGGSIVVERINKNARIQECYLDTVTAMQNFTDSFTLVLDKSMDTTFELSKNIMLQNILSGQEKEKR